MFFEKLAKLIDENPRTKKMFGFGQDIVAGAAEDTRVLENFQSGMWLIHNDAGALLDYFTKQVFTHRKFACKAGCNYCCHLRVAASPLEIFMIARFVKKNLSGVEIEKLKNKLRQNCQMLVGVSSAQHTAMKMPCALLDSKGRCSVYESRPFSCRRWLSYDVKPCEETFNSPSGQGEIPLDGEIYALGIGIEDGLGREFVARKLDDDYYELQSGLLCALENEQAETDWCNGIKVFRGCTSEADGQN